MATNITRISANGARNGAAITPVTTTGVVTDEYCITSNGNEFLLVTNASGAPVNLTVLHPDDPNCVNDINAIPDGETWIIGAYGSDWRHGDTTLKFTADGVVDVFAVTCDKGCKSVGCAGC